MIIVGNGFDLAHGLKTSYEHFLINFFKEKLSIINELRSVDHPLIKARVKFPSIDFSSELNDELTLNDISIILDEHCVVEEISKFLMFSKKDILTKKWTDFESIYYLFLIESIDKTQGDFISINKLNEHFEFLKIEIVNYIKNQENAFLFNANNHLMRQFLTIFRSDLTNKWGLNYINNIEGNNSVKSIILNFNYTNIISKYIDSLSDIDIKEIQIHGNLNFNPSIVFGFGDELDKHYQRIEDLNNNEYFKHIKSFSYLENIKYQDLMKFVSESESIEIMVLGHSLGLSDRTMLNQILESSNVKRVKMFFKPGDNGKDLRDKTYSISRHFKDKAKMRLVIEPHSMSQPMPQFND